MKQVFTVLVVISLLLTAVIIAWCIEKQQAVSPENVPVVITTIKTPTVIETQHVPVMPAYTPTPLDVGKENRSVQLRDWIYVLRGNRGIVTAPLYKEIYEYQQTLEDKSRCYRYIGDFTPCNSEETHNYYMSYLNEKQQVYGMDQLIDQIRSQTSDPDDQVRIAVSLVQNIPYQKDVEDIYNIQYPYETLYRNSGVCSDKSVLLVYILRDLGYESAVLSFRDENHAVVGIRTQPDYTYKQTGYAFIETTNPAIITDSNSRYTEIGTLSSDPMVITLSSGKSLDNLTEEYGDASAYTQIMNNGHNNSPLVYREWETLVWKYGLLVSENTSITEDPRNKPLCDGDRYCNGQCYTECDMPEAVWSCTEQGGVCLVTEEVVIP